MRTAAGLLLLGYAHAAPRNGPPRHWYEDNFRPAPWRCDEPRSRANTNYCFKFDDSLTDDGVEDVRRVNMDREPVKTNRTCCGLPPVACSDEAYPLTCLLEKIPFATPPACVKRQFACCLGYWNRKFQLEETYRRAPPHVRCKGRLWDVYDIRADDVIFDQRSLMKLAAAFYPKILVPYEDEMMPPANQIHPIWRGYVVLAKLGFGWINVEQAKPDALVLAQNLLRNPANARTAYALPRGVKDLVPWRDHCLDNVNADHVRCVGMKLHRDRVKKFRALRQSGVCTDARKASDHHTGKVDHGVYVQAMSDADYVPSPPGVGFVNYRSVRRPFYARRWRARRLLPAQATPRRSWPAPCRFWSGRGGRPSGAPSRTCTTNCPTSSSRTTRPGPPCGRTTCRPCASAATRGSTICPTGSTTSMTVC